MYIVEWTYEPTDYFEVPVEFACGDFTVSAKDGRLRAEIPDDLYPTDHSLRSVLHHDVHCRFLAAQVMNETPYVLSNPSVARHRLDGGIDAFMFAQTIGAGTVFGRADFIQKDADGNIVRDTRTDRIIARNEFAQLVGQFSDNAVLIAILRSYSAAMNDSKNELIHLYEIRESLATLFGGEALTRKTLDFEKPQWSTLGRLANDEPIRQGRHRGKHNGELRDATGAELSQARSIARDLILSYARTLS